jgi:hypothetical protein
LGSITVGILISTTIKEDKRRRQLI